MSATGRGAARAEFDFYSTPRWCWHRFLEAYALPGGLWFEPCAGAAALVHATRQVRSDVKWLVNELDTRHLPLLQQTPDILAVSNFDARYLEIGPGFSAIVTNPPFIIAEEILRRCLLARGALTIFLQRQNWCSGPRAALFRALKPSMYVLPNRPSFKDVVWFDEKEGKWKKSTTDSTEYAWFVFDGLGRFVILDETPDEVRRAEIAERRANEKLLIDTSLNGKLHKPLLALPPNV